MSREEWGWEEKRYPKLKENQKIRSSKYVEGTLCAYSFALQYFGDKDKAWGFSVLILDRLMQVGSDWSPSWIYSRLKGVQASTLEKNSRYVNNDLRRYLETNVDECEYDLANEIELDSIAREKREIGDAVGESEIDRFNELSKGLPYGRWFNIHHYSDPMGDAEGKYLVKYQSPLSNNWVYYYVAPSDFKDFYDVYSEDDGWHDSPKGLLDKSSMGSPKIHPLYSSIKRRTKQDIEDMRRFVNIADIGRIGFSEDEHVEDFLRNLERGVIE